MQLRARTLRTALVASALMTAVAVPAAAAEAPDRTTTREAVRPAQVVRSFDYNLRTGRLLGLSSSARGRMNWSRNSVRNVGSLRDRGRGFSRVTFRHERFRGRSITRTFVVNDGLRSTSYRLSGRFDRIMITQCKVLSRQRTTCTTRSFRQFRR
jgi:hypothetical protein